ncbi:hypothetical protein Sliba_24170 [Streptomyces nigrescens]|uniref:Uncharacterized protein n=1 Tax=Streptomyces nigrescens TaxID=1920 RepID=A0A640TFL8_STRNI|nr:hypothetical protein Sliba_24170 [Streptomyces libani subsp. libani]GGV89657.1 hypothetical protein GCM10010500_15000 [Streptomyces libani subsp. libani]
MAGRIRAALIRGAARRNECPAPPPHLGLNSDIHGEFTVTAVWLSNGKRAAVRIRVRGTAGRARGKGASRERPAEFGGAGSPASVAPPGRGPARRAARRRAAAGDGVWWR